MTQDLGVLQDIELLPEALPVDLWWGVALAACLLVAGVVWFWRKQQQSVVRALRRLEQLPDSPPDPAMLVAIVRGAGRVPPVSFDHARFAPTPCTPETFAALKREARSLLEQAR